MVARHSANAIHSGTPWRSSFLLAWLHHPRSSISRRPPLPPWVHYTSSVLCMRRSRPEKPLTRRLPPTHNVAFSNRRLLLPACGSSSCAFPFTARPLCAFYLCSLPRPPQIGCHGGERDSGVCADEASSLRAAPFPTHGQCFPALSPCMRAHLC